MVGRRKFLVGVFMLSTFSTFAWDSPKDCFGQSTDDRNSAILDRPDSDRDVILERTQRYVRELLKKYDTNKNQALEPAEAARMRGKLYPSVDRDGDGRMTSEELVHYYSAGSRERSARNNASKTASNTSESSSADENRSTLNASPTVELKFRLVRLPGGTELPEDKDKDKWKEVLASSDTVFSIHTSLICGRESSFQVGQTLPQVVGESVNTRQGTSRQIRMVDVGSILKLTPLHEGQSLSFTFQLEHSGVRPTDDPFAQPVERLQISQSLKLQPDGTATAKITQGSVCWLVLVDAEQ